MNKITKKRYVLWGMGILFCLVFCYPLFSNTLVRGHDTYFHLARIEALKEAYIHGDFFRDYIMNKILILVMEPLCSTRIFF